MAEGALEGCKALVTGGAQGLGAGMAQALAAAGARVMIGDIQDAAETASGIDGSATHLDVTDEASWEAAIERTLMMSEQECEEIGARARRWFLENKSGFPQRVRSALALLDSPAALRPPADPSSRAHLVE